MNSENLCITLCLGLWGIFFTQYIYRILFHFICIVFIVSLQQISIVFVKIYWISTIELIYNNIVFGDLFYVLQCLIFISVSFVITITHSN